MNDDHFNDDETAIPLGIAGKKRPAADEKLAKRYNK